jgi:delta8-fatty-acid desaturase
VENRFHGGLQFQIEHHLFPRLPRHNLRQARDLVIPFAKKHGIKYVEVSFLEANKMCIQTLKEAAVAAKKAKVEPWAQFVQSMIWEGANARG